MTAIPAVSAMDATSDLEAFEAMMISEVHNNGNNDLMKWATIDTEEENALYGAYRRDNVRLLRARRKKVEFLRQLEKGGQEKMQVARHDEYYRRILADYFREREKKG